LCNLLVNGRQILITEQTVIEDDGDYTSFEEVAQALEAGNEVEADGEYYYNSADAIWVAISIKFESDSDSDSDNDSD